MRLLLLLRVDAVQETTTLDKECRSIGDVREEYTDTSRVLPLVLIALMDVTEVQFDSLEGLQQK